MIDLHSHILPNLDDGPSSLSRCLMMAKTAAGTGVTHLYATPHHLNGQFENSKDDILECVIRINKYLQQNNIQLTIHPGQELRIHRDLFNTIDRDEVLTLDNKGKYILLELPSSKVPEYTNDIVYELLLKDITPIIVHPERNKEFIEYPHLLFELVNEGVLTQLTSASIMGHFGKKVKSFSEKIIDHHLAHFIASDAHNTSNRSFLLHEAYEWVTKVHGLNYTYYFKLNAELLMNGDHIQCESPIQFRKKILGIF